MAGLKRMLSIFLAMMMLLSCNVVGFAATKPTAKCTSYSSVVRRGKTAKFVFKVKTGSFTYKNNFYRAGIATAMTYKMSSSQTKSFIAKAPAKSIAGFPKNGTMTQKWPIPKNWSKGNWRFVYATFYRAKNSSNAWRINRDNIKQFTVTVK